MAEVISKKIYCDICGKEIKRTDEAQMSIMIEKKSFIWDELGGYHLDECKVNDVCPQCISKLYKGFIDMGLKFTSRTEGRARY